jgi:hypothetical protein
MEEYDAGWTGPGDFELITPEDFLPPNPFPLDAQRMGVDRWSDDAAMIALAASLDPAKLSHRIVAWVMLVAILSPLVLTLHYELFTVS